MLRAHTRDAVVTACPLLVWVLTAQLRTEHSPCAQCVVKKQTTNVTVEYCEPKKGRIEMTEARGSGERVHICHWCRAGREGLMGRHLSKDLKKVKELALGCPGRGV